MITKKSNGLRDGITLRVIVSYPVGFFLFHSGNRGNGILATSNFCKNIHYRMKSGWSAPNWERENVSLYQCVLQIYLDSSNLEEMLSGLWVLSTSVGGTGSFSAPTVTHSMSESAHKTQSISSKSRKTKKVPTPT